MTSTSSFTSFIDAWAPSIHNCLPFFIIGLVTYFSPPDDLYLSSFLQLFAGISSTILLSAGASELSFSTLFRCRRLQAYKTGPKARVEEAMETIRAASIFSAFAAIPRGRFLAGKATAVVFTLAEAQPDYPDAMWLYIVKLFFVTLLVDFYMYFKHRLLHSRPLWAFHRDHHSFHNPSPFASFAVAPVEATLTFWPVSLLALPSAPILGQAYMMWVAGFVLLNLYLHAGYEGQFAETCLRAVGLNSSSFHNVHHEKTHQNFGELCYIWDSILKSGSHPEKKKE